MKSTLILTFFSLVISGYSQVDSAQHKTTYKKANYEIQYPQSWNMDTSKMMGTEFFIFSPVENDSDNFRENLNFIIQDLSGKNVDLQKYKEVTEKQLADLTTDSKIYESAILKNDKGSYLKIVYSMTQGKFRLKITSVCFIKNDKVYLVTFTTLLDTYDKFKAVGEEILNSFNVRN